MKARIIKQIGHNGNPYWAISIRASDGTRGLFKMDFAEYNQLNTESGEEHLKGYFDMICTHINQKNKFLEAIYAPGGFIPNRKEGPLA